MDLVVGTSGGIFLANSGQPAGGVNARIVRQLIQVGDDLFAAGADGVYRSASGGQDWTRCGVDAGEVWNLGLAPSDQGLYAGTQPAHLFVSRDKGDSWQEVPSFLDTPGAERWCVPNSPQGARALALAFDRFNSQRMWVGVEVGGVVTTEDGGAHWSARWVGPNADVHLLATHPSRPDVLFATTGFGRNDDKPMEPAMAGPYRSDDGGQAWHYLGGAMGPHYTRAMCIDARPPFALTVPAVPDVRSSVRDPGGAQAVLYQSVDAGDSWRALGDKAHSPSAERLTAVAPDPDVAGGVLVGTETGEVWRVSPEAVWTCLCDGLPAVQALLPIT